MESLVKTKGIVATFMLVLPLFCGSSICAADGFDSVRCGSDVRKALLGRKMSNERIVVLQERQKDLGLKDLSGTELSDRIFLIFWRFCGEENDLLEAQDNEMAEGPKYPKQSTNSHDCMASCVVHDK